MGASHYKRYWPKSVLFKGGGSIQAQISGKGGHHPPTSVGIRKVEYKYWQCVLWFRHKAHVTDGQTHQIMSANTANSAIHPLLVNK